MTFKEFLSENAYGNLANTGGEGLISKLLIKQVKSPIQRKMFSAGPKITKPARPAGITSPGTPMTIPSVLEMTGPHNFSCVMAVIPKKESKEIMDWSKQFVPDDCLFKDEGGREDEIHVTVLYGLHTNSPVPVKKVLGDFSPFTIRLGKVSRFVNKSEYDVLKFDIAGDELRNINKALRKMPYTSNYDTYQPHCTIAYIKKGSCSDLIGSKDFLGRKIKIDDLVFSPASGERTRISL